MFQTPPNDDVGKNLTLMLNGIEAIDQDRQLCLKTTNGRTSGARRWFVHRMTDKCKVDWDAGKVVFRAWNLQEAIDKVNTDTRTVNRIMATFK